jgi:hypothetical protein
MPYSGVNGLSTMMSVSLTYILHIAPGADNGRAAGGSWRVNTRVVGDVCTDETMVVGVKCEGDMGSAAFVGAPLGVSGRKK